MTVLIVDDSLSARARVSGMMISLGFQTLEASSGDEALRLLGRLRNPPELMMIDWHMTEMSGYEFVRSVRADSRYKACRLMMITSGVGSDHVSEALEAGVNEYVTEPFTGQTISDKLELLGLAA
jgi:CheY-like chemotaxis protein